MAAMATAMRVTPRGPNSVVATASPMNVFQRVEPWNSDVKLGPSSPSDRSRTGRSASSAPAIRRMAPTSAPPTPSTGTEPRSARARVSMMMAGKKM